MTSEALVKAYRLEAERQQQMVRKAELTAAAFCFWRPSNRF